MSYGTTTKVRNYTGFTTANCAALTDLIITDLIVDSDREVEVLTGRKWASTSFTETLDGTRADLFENQILSLMLSNFPIISIDSFIERDLSDSSTAYTFHTPVAITNGLGFDTTNNDYEVDGNIGKITFVSGRSVAEGPKRYTISYTYGYASVPTEIVEISSCLAAVRAIAFMTGGIYDGVKNYSVPEQNVGKEQAERLRMTAEMLAKRAENLIDSPTVGRRERTLVGFTKGTRWGFQDQLTS